MLFLQYVEQVSSRMSHDRSPGGFRLYFSIMSFVPTPVTT